MESYFIMTGTSFFVFLVLIWICGVVSYNMLSLSSLAILVLVIGVIMCIWCYFEIAERQKTRDTQQPRMYVSTVRNRTSISQSTQPSIYITPANMPPPKYEAMAPPSYEEVVGIHYPTFSPPAPAPPPGPQPPPAPAPAATTSRSDTTTITVASS